MGTISSRLVWAEFLRKDSGFAFADCVYGTADARLRCRFEQVRKRLIHWFFGERERSIVHGDEMLRVEIDKGLYRIFRTHVNAAEAVGLVRANRQQGDLRRQALADFAEAGK